MNDIFNADNISGKERFTNRVENYVKFRPTYPSEAIDWIVSTANIFSDTVIADLGSGMGKFTGQLLERGFQAFGVEPNENIINPRFKTKKSLKICWIASKIKNKERGIQYEENTFSRREIKTGSRSVGRSADYKRNSVGEQHSPKPIIKMEERCHKKYAEPV
jgi:hypothetical protein